MKAAAVSGALLLLAAFGLWAVLGRDRGVGPAAEAGSLSSVRIGTELTLVGVEFREVRQEGAAYRMTCDRATYAVAAKILSADGVTVALPGRSGDVVVRAPRASWGMDAGTIDLPDGGEAADGTGWSARVPEAHLHLAARELTAREASVRGPGLTVSGDNLVWRWKEGTVSLDAPRSRVEPAKAAGRRG